MRVSSATFSSDGETREIYLDYLSSTPCDPMVVESMMPYLLHEYANPSSSHRAGGRAEAAIEEARASVAGSIGAAPEELVFTSGATESNNLAILGAAVAAPPGRDKVIVSSIEHKSVLAPCEALTKSGRVEVRICPVDEDGIVDLAELAKMLDASTALVSVQTVNNELGSVQPLREVAQLAHAAGALVHTDAVQALGKIPFDVDILDLDLVSLSAHKCYGPKGTGALFMRSGLLAVLAPVVYGGGQERSLRPGTQNVPGIVGFGCAAQIAEKNLDEETPRISQLRDWLERALMEDLDGCSRNGSRRQRIPGAISLTVPGVDSDAVIATVPRLMISSSSACNAGAPQPSHVLLAIGRSREEAQATLRISLGRFTTRREVETARHLLFESVRRLQLAS